MAHKAAKLSEEHPLEYQDGCSLVSGLVLGDRDHHPVVVGVLRVTDGCRLGELLQGHANDHRHPLSVRLHDPEHKKGGNRDVIVHMEGVVGVLSALIQYLHSLQCRFRVVGLLDQVPDFLRGKDRFSPSALHGLHLVFGLESLC